MSVNPKHIAAKKVLDFYLEQLEESDTEEAGWALQYINLQMAKYRCNAMLTMLYSYPVSVTEVQ